MASRPLASRLLSRFDRRWFVALLVVAGLVLAVRAIPRSVPEPPLQLVALSPAGDFRDTLDVPVSWGDTARRGPTAFRVPIVLAVRNTGARPGRPAMLTMSLPVSYRLAGTNTELEAVREAGSPLVAYTVDTDLGPVEPGRMPTLLPALDTLWLEVVIPAFHCVILADSVPEFIPAPAPPVETLSSVRIFYSFEGGDLSQRRTGTLAIRLDTALFSVERPEPRPSFPVLLDSALATPEVGELRVAGRGFWPCGDPQDPMELETTLWLTAAGGQVIALGHNGTIRKRLYDLDADGVIERESWDPDSDGVLEATRQARLPTPEFLLRVQPVDPGEEAGET